MDRDVRNQTVNTNRPLNIEITTATLYPTAGNPIKCSGLVKMDRQ